VDLPIIQDKKKSILKKYLYILKNVIDRNLNSVSVDSLTSFFEMGGQAWSFGLNSSEACDFLKEYNLTVIRDVGASYYKENYLKPIERNLAVSQIERIIYAKII